MGSFSMNNPLVICDDRLLYVDELMDHARVGVRVGVRVEQFIKCFNIYQLAGLLTVNCFRSIVN